MSDAERRKVEGLICRVVGRSNNNANANGGVVYANANNASSNSNTNNGSRLANNNVKKFNKIVPTAYHYEIVDSCGRETRASVTAIHSNLTRNGTFWKTEKYHWQVEFSRMETFQGT